MTGIASRLLTPIGRLKSLHQEREMEENRKEHVLVSGLSELKSNGTEHVDMHKSSPHRVSGAGRARAKKKEGWDTIGLNKNIGEIPLSDAPACRIQLGKGKLRDG